MTIGAETITIIRASVANDWRGDPVGTPTETDVTGCSVQPGTTTSRTDERTDQRSAVMDAVTVYAPFGTDVRVTDRARWRGVVYEVDGQPAFWRDLDGFGHYAEFRLINVEG